MARIPRSSFVLSLALLAAAGGAHAATFTVNSTAHTADAAPGDGTCADAAGACSLRAAIQEANAHPNGAGPDRIHFSIPGAGPYIIRPSSILPAITDPVIIDGYTQAGAVVNTDPLATNAVLQIELDGSAIARFESEYGLELETDDSVIRGLAVHGYFVNIRIRGSRTVVEGCFIGADLSGLAGDPSQGSGITVGALGDLANDNLIGGDAPGARNLISGNPGVGVSIFHTSSMRNRVQGNLIGTDRSGLAALPNSELLVQADNAAGGPGAAVIVGCDTFVHAGGCANQVGGPGAGQGNVISGNASFGIAGGGGDWSIEGNRIGLAVNGTPLPNGLGGANAGAEPGGATSLPTTTVRVSSSGSARRSVSPGTRSLATQISGST